MEVNSNPLHIPPFTPAWLFSDAYIKRLVERWTKAHKLADSIPSHDPACVRWAILTALTGEWYRGAAINGIKIQDWRGPVLASTWVKENHPGLRTLQERVRNARVLAAVDLSPVVQRAGIVKARGLLGVGSSTMAAQVTRGRQLPLKCTETASNGLFCNVRWLSGDEDGSSAWKLSELGGLILRRVRFLEDDLPSTLTSAPSWLHPYLDWWHLHESRIHPEAATQGKTAESDFVPANIAGFRSVTMSRPLWTGDGTPPPDWLRNK